ncbi:MAG: hypothetical protein HKN29_07790 [Rhodothermales bacterium]|nr:hypothetical protein [Rhodothermales bacterium]
MNGGASDRRMRNGLIGMGAVVLVLLVVFFAPVSFTPQERVPAKVFARQTWSVEHSGRGEVISRLADRQAGVSDLLSVHSIERGDVAGFRLAAGVALGAEVLAGDTVGVYRSARSDREMIELASLVDVAASEAATFSEGAKAALVEAAQVEVERIRGELTLQQGIVARLKELQTQGVVSLDEVERAQTAEVSLSGRLAVAEAELEVLRTGDRDSVRRLAATRLTSSRRQLEALSAERESYVLRAPMSGTVTRSPGDSVLVTVKTLGRWVAISPVPMALKESVSPGMNVSLEIEGASAEATILHIDPEVQDLGGESVILVTMAVEGMPEGLRDRQAVELVLTGARETLRDRATAALGSLFTWKTWWSHAPRA